ncbi:deoxycytidylate deaminase [Flavobacterium sp. 28A]|uniref:anti-phage dCTP deaminase n=1 Tax=Flavobacterium sp. 28A TaxID=2735895 RepID=UPI001570BD05|nr:anti-phage dCTP deaminase [Flavobacterium sp. 28A]NRT14160.1 deoxycytidylate deaminase [Flavobacterium sp. 28A]
MEALKLTEFDESIKKSLKKSDTIDKVDKTLTEELFIGICSPIGSIKEAALESIENIIKINYGYTVERIKLSDFIEDSEETLLEEQVGKTKVYNQYYHKIERGNSIREKFNNSHLAEKTIQKIHLERLAEVKDKGAKTPTAEDFTSRRKCYIIDSIKSKEELDLFRKVYTENFYQISIFSPIDDRKANLLEKGFKKDEIENIIEIDDKQNFKHGQNVRGTFVDGDFFMRISESNKAATDIKVKRFFDLIFESAIITPTVEEQSMYYAKSAAGNSACLSRQVGACIVDENSNILSTGWNDVPKYGGNLYTSNTTIDNRCFNKGFCSNDTQKDKLVDNIVDSLITDVELKDIFQKDGVTIQEDLISKIKFNLRNSKVKDLIEFSRSVHAEMHAIIQGSQITGTRMINGKLFCTTYPCHNCARHIIAAGIKEVYYIEPYVKSLCLTLHSDAMTENENISDRVKILMFDGVAPRNYLLFFTNFAERKDNGKLIKKNLKNIKPKKAKSLQALSTLEQQAVHTLRSK